MISTLNTFVPDITKITVLTLSDLSYDLDTEHLRPWHNKNNSINSERSVVRGTEHFIPEADITKITVLTLRDLSYEALNTFIPDITKITILTLRDLSYEALNTFIPDITKITVLTLRDLSYKALNTFVPDITKITILTLRDLSYEALNTFVPDVVWRTAMLYTVPVCPFKVTTNSLEPSSHTYHIKMSNKFLTICKKFIIT
jgi:hypothetical protein